MKATAYIKAFKKSMTELGTYKPMYDGTIAILSDMREQYDILTARLADGGYQFAEATGQGNVKRHPDIAALENLRKDILNYSNALGLTPQGLKKLMDEVADSKPTNVLAAALKELGDL